MANKGLIEFLDMSIEQKALAMLACVAQETKVAMARLVNGFGLSLLQVQILHALDCSKCGTLTVNQLKSSMLDETPNVSRTLNKLADMGMVTKSRSDEDQRVVFVTITSEGRNIHRLADKALLTYKSPLNTRESSQLYELLSRF